jgi:hypothetical protein
MSREFNYDTELNLVPFGPWPVAGGYWTPGQAHTWSSYATRPAVQNQNYGAFQAGTIPLPRIDVFKPGDAIYADYVGVPTAVDARHVAGVYAARLDGSARWVDHGRFDEYLNTTQAMVFDNGVGPTVTTHDQIWAALGGS